jgi:hypothetical protein
MHNASGLGHIGYFNKKSMKKSIDDISICLICQPLETTRERTMQIVIGLITGLKVSPKSMPGG